MISCLINKMNRLKRFERIKEERSKDLRSHRENILSFSANIKSARKIWDIKDEVKRDLMDAILCFDFYYLVEDPEFTLSAEFWSNGISENHIINKLRKACVSRVKSNDLYRENMRNFWGYELGLCNDMSIYNMVIAEADEVVDEYIGEIDTKTRAYGRFFQKTEFLLENFDDPNLFELYLRRSPYLNGGRISDMIDHNLIVSVRRLWSND